MESNNSRSTSNLNQRLQIVAERRAQIDEAKRERAQRQLEANMRATPAPQAPFATNPSVAFGSTRPRNIDLTRPLVTPIPNARPKSEIFTGSYYGGSSSGGGGGGHSTTDAATPVYAKDDTNYATPRSARTPAAESMPALMTQSMSVNSFQPSSSSSSSYRAVRRHDPELVPAMTKYVFREYAMPSSSTTPIRKENSMVSSMISTKSFQASSVYRTPFGGPQNRPKKSFSMNRLDQLAQPRRRVEPKVPTSASFVRSKEYQPSSVQKKPASATPESGERGPKPAPPPKTLFKSPKPVPNAESGSGSSSSTVKAQLRPAPTSRRPQSRPSSQIVESLAPAPIATEEKPMVEGENVEGGETNEADRLAEYKRALAEKRAMYRKQQEEQQQAAPVRRAKIIKPETRNSEEAEDTKDHSSSSSSSSSSDSESETEASKQSEATVLSGTDATITAAVPQNEQQAAESSSLPEATTDSQAAVATEQLISFGSESEPSMPAKPASENLMTTSLTGDFATLSISAEQKNRALANASMTGSLDASLLSSANANSGSSQRPQSVVLTKEQLDERSAKLLLQDKAEREKRKNRVAEILKRTRKEDKKEDAKQSSGDSSQSENESGPSNGSETNGHKYNGLNGDSSKAESHSNGHLNHHQRFVSESEQSLPPTNGF